jgi:signal transduction histidine kinase
MSAYSQRPAAALAAKQSLDGASAEEVDALGDRAQLAALQSEVATAVTQERSLPAMLERCTEMLVRNLDAALSRIWTLNTIENLLELQASAGTYSHIDTGYARIPVGKSEIGSIAQQRQPYLTNSVIGDPLVPEQEWAKQAGLVAFAGYPLLVEDRLVGVMAMFSRRPFPEQTLDALRTVAKGIAMGIERMHSEQALRKSQEQLEALVNVRTLELFREVLERKRAEQRLSELSTRLLKLQDDERRRIARELHDSAGQYLAAVRMNLGVLQKDPSLSLDAAKSARLAETIDIVERCNSEIRTMSYLLHPPLLDEMGLASAIGWFAEGFAERSGISVELDIPRDFDRLPSDIETALFRIVQQGLANVHRHSGSRSAKIKARLDAESVIVEICDEGRGIPPDVLQEFEAGTRFLGVGIAGMRERIRAMGGQFNIRSSSTGTTIEVRLPAPEISSPASE